MKFKIAVAKGDGVGPEVVDGALIVLDRVSNVFGHEFEYTQVMVGGEAYDHCNDPLPAETIEKIQESQAVLFGAVGGDKWDHLPGDLRPEKAILGLRQALNVYSNIRPGILFPSFATASPLKQEIIKNGFDLCVVRELVGGIYFGEKGRDNKSGVEEAFDVERYNENEIERIARSAFQLAMKRRMKLTSVDKANVLESSKLWRQVVDRVGKDYPMVELSHLYIDNAAMQLIKDPNQFDVILTSNIFGDILSDEISMLTGSIGLLPSASIGEGTMGLYEPIHGSAPDIQGKNIANPVGAILSAAMMLEHSFNLKKEAEAIRFGVNKVFELGYGTSDIKIDGIKILGTKEMADLIAKNIC